MGLRRRDPDLLDALIEQYQHRLLRYLLHLTGNRAVAEDLFQETWLRVLEKGHQYDGRNRFVYLADVHRDITWPSTICGKRNPSQPRRDEGYRRTARRSSPEAQRPVAARYCRSPPAARKRSS